MKQLSNLIFATSLALLTSYHLSLAYTLSENAVARIRRNSAIGQQAFPSNGKVIFHSSTRSDVVRMGKTLRNLSSSDGNGYDVNPNLVKSPVKVSEISLEELRKIANQQGYDTNGMDRNDLEKIASWFQVNNNGDERESLEMISKEQFPPFTLVDTKQQMPKAQNVYQELSTTAEIQGRQMIPNEQQSSNIIVDPTRQQNTNTGQEQDNMSETGEPYYNYDIITTPTYSKKESIKAAIVGFFAGSIAASPITFLHTMSYPPADIMNNEMSQFQYDTLTAGIAAAAFSTIYRYFISRDSGNSKTEDDSFSLSNNVVGAFVLSRSFSRLLVSFKCIGLYCGAPLGIMDWEMALQFAFNFAENLALFGAAAISLDYACREGFVSYVYPDQRRSK